jgi:hypothetical protein
MRIDRPLAMETSAIRHKHINGGACRAVGIAALLGTLALAQFGCSSQTSTEAFKPAPDKDSPVAQQELQQKIQEVQNDPGVPAAAKAAYISHMAGGPASGAMSVGPKPASAPGK